MTYFCRSIDEYLLNWKTAHSHKPLLLRGARQVGKTSSVRELGKKFKHFVELNFLYDKRARKLFQKEVLDPAEICSEIALLYEKTVEDGETLLFLDEAQACPEAIEALRFFHERRPLLHVVAAGSLLEFALQDLPSFGVGRIQSVFMRPLTFFEFLDAIGKQRLRAAIEGVSLKSPFPATIHEQALTQLKLYMMVGGLPEVVSTMSENVYNHQQAASILSSLLLNYEDDFNKYRGKIPELRLRDCLRAAAQQAGKKFVYRHAYVDAVSSQVHSACSLLEKAGLIVKVAHTSANGLPLGAEADSTKFKYALFDLGIYQKLSGFALRDAVTEETANFVHRGALSEIYVGNELLGHMPCTERAELWYWHRESRSSVAELDYVAECNNRVIPIEVKTGTRGRMKSMYRFLEEKKLPLGVRLCAENFAKYDNILVVPLYATGRLAEILEDS